MQSVLSVIEEQEMTLAQALEEVLAVDRGDLITEVSHPMPDEEREQYEARLESVPRAHAAAAARVHQLFAG